MTAASLPTRLGGGGEVDSAARDAVVSLANAEGRFWHWRRGRSWAGFRDAAEGSEQCGPCQPVAKPRVARRAARRPPDKA